MKQSEFDESCLWKAVYDFIQTTYPGADFHTEYGHRDIVVFHQGQVIEIELKKTFNKDSILQGSDRTVHPKANLIWLATSTNFMTRKWKYYNGTKKLLSALGLGYIFVNMTNKRAYHTNPGGWDTYAIPKEQDPKPRDIHKQVTDTIMFKDLLRQTPGVTKTAHYTEFKGILEKMYYEIREIKSFTKKEYAEKTSIKWNPSTLKNYLEDFFYGKMGILSKEKKGRSFLYTYIPHTQEEVYNKIMSMKIGS